MSTIHIRAAKRDDLPALVRIEETCFSADRRSRPQSLRHGLKSPFQCVQVAVLGREVVGAMTLYLYPRTVRIYSVAVLPEFRRCGAGRRLVKQALQLARRTGRRAVSLEAAQANRVLTGWYETFGFRPAETLKDYYSRGCHAVRMRQELPTTALKGGRARGGS
jgi:ribosomal protein S18 acetylase RimI-like enzyme